VKTFIETAESGDLWHDILDLCDDILAKDAERSAVTIYAAMLEKKVTYAAYMAANPDIAQLTGEALQHAYFTDCVISYQINGLNNAVSIAAYLQNINETTNLTDDDAARLASIVYAGEFAKFRNGVPGSQDASFYNYLKMNAFTAFIKSGTVAPSNLTADEYADAFIAAGHAAEDERNMLLAHAQRCEDDPDNDDCTMYLPEDLQVQMLFAKYQDQRLQYASSGQIDDALEAEKNAGYNETAIAKAARLLAIANGGDRYYGQDTNTYLDTIDSEIRRAVRDALNGGTGIGYVYDTESLVAYYSQKYALLTDSIYSQIDKIDADYEAARGELTRMSFAAEQKKANAETALEWKGKPASFDNYRNYLISMGATGVDLVQIVNTDYWDAFQLGNIPADYLSAYDGNIELLGTSISETANMLRERLVLLADMGKMSELKAKYSISNAMSRVAGIVRDLSVGQLEDSLASGELYSFILETQNAMAEKGSEVFGALSDEIGQMHSNYDNLCRQVIDTYKLYDNMSKSLAEIKKEASDAFAEYQDLNTKYTAAEEALQEAQETYDTLHASYVDTLGEQRELWTASQNATFAYEKAFAVWEYANTPYLKEQESLIASTGNMVDEEGKAYTTNGATTPDAKQCMSRPKRNGIMQKLLLMRATTAKNNQKTVATLNADVEYKKHREALESKLMTHARVARAEVVAERDIMDRQRAVDVAQNEYTQALQGLMTEGFMAGIDTSNEELMGKVDNILSRVVKSGGGIDSFMEKLFEYVIILPKKRTTIYIKYIWRIE
jgi:hypothetical protein